ncbi:MAG: NAD(P)H nitroreductase [Actinomycetia bacterium]|nr:NAD(P)H nitroreductase [Actinomycetes bacterium]
MPATQVQSEVVIAALQLACRAPSLHNSQPWRWVATDRFVQLFADPTRLARSTDPTGREALVSCGAVLDHFRVAMSAAGWHTRVHRFPDPGNPLHLATIDFRSAPVSIEHTRRADAILLRRTDRLPLSAPPGWSDLADTLSQRAVPDAVRVDVIADDFRESVARASHVAQALRAQDITYHSELCWWTVDFTASEGIPPNSLLSEAESGRVDIGRAFPPVAQPERRAEIDDDRSKLLALSTLEDSRYSVLRCGEALSAVLLDAASAGMSTCTLTHITEAPASRDIISSLLPGDAVPEALVRVGLAPAMGADPAPTPRRPIEHVLQIHSGQTC